MKLFALTAAVATVAGALAIACVARPGASPTAALHTSVQPPASTWQTTIDAALQTAVATHKDALILFTAARTDPTPNAADFGDPVLARIDPPDTTAHPEDLSVTLWSTKLNVLDTPTVVLFGADGRPCATAVLHSTGELTPALLHTLQEARAARDVALAVSHKTTGPDQARALDAALTAVGPFASIAYRPEIDKLLALDSDNAMKLQEKYLPAVLADDIDAAIQREVYPLVDRHDFPAALAVMDRLITTIGPKSGKMDVLLAFRGQLQYSAGDKSGALATLDKAKLLAQAGSPNEAQILAARDKILASQ